MLTNVGRVRVIRCKLSRAKAIPVVLTFLNVCIICNP